MWALLLTITPLIAPKIATPEARAAFPECATAGYTKSGTDITITPSHGKVMYIDTGVSPKIDAAYVGYRITNNTGAALSGYFVSLTDFRGGAVSLANVADANQQLLDSSSPLPEVGIGQTKTVYFLLKASASSKAAQTHTVSVYAGRPDAADASPITQCDFSFSKVAETIKAAANKVSSVSVKTTGTLQAGQLVTVEVRGATGTIGAGQAPDFRVMWFSPAAYSSFPTRAVRLESVQLVTSDTNANFNSSSDIRVYDERLLIKTDTNPEQNAASLITYDTFSSYKRLEESADDLVGKRWYKNVYRFRVIGKSATAATMSPVGQISSGTQIKHTDLAASSLATLATQNVTTPLTVSKGLSTGSFYAGTGEYSNYVRASYRLTVTTTSSSELAVEEVVDIPPSGAIFTGSASYRIGSGTITAITPIRLSSESGLSPQPYHFIGPFKIVSGTALTVDYQMYIPLASGTYTNTAKAIIGDQTITDSTGFQLPGVQIQTDGTSVTSAGSTTTALTPEVVTLPASVTSGSTILYGTVDPNLSAGSSVLVVFEYGTDSSLSSYTTISVGSASGSSVVGRESTFSGTAGTTYYYRIVAKSADGSTRYPGDILSFTTFEPVGTPVAITNLPLSVGSTTATLSGQVDPNLNTMTEIRFVVSTSSSFTVGSTYIITDVQVETNGSETTINATASGSSPTEFTYDLTGLTRGQTYYYRIESVYSGGTVTGERKSFKTGTTPQTITFNAGSNALISVGSKTVSGTSSEGLTLTYTSESTDICTVSTNVVSFVKVGTCAITASQDGNDTISAAQPVTSSFEILPSAPTVTTDAASSVGQRSATLNGTVNVGGANSTDIRFRYSTTSAHVSGGTGGTLVDADLTPVSENASPTLTLTGLQLSTTYYYRVEATNTTGTSVGSVVSFTTLGLTSRTLSLSVASATLQFGSDTFNTQATPSAGASEGTKSWTSASTSVCTVVSSTGVVTIVSAGTCLLDASITSGSTFASANATQLSLIIAPKPVTVTATNVACNNCTTPQTTNFSHSSLVGTDEIGSVTYQFLRTGTAGFDPASSTAPTNSNPAGDYQIVISNATMSSGTASNYEFNYVNGTYTVTSLLDQTITFTTGSTQTYKTPFTISATVSSGSAVTFSKTGDCLLSDPTIVASGTGTVTVTPTAAGTDNCSITASQSGGGTYGPASSVTRLISILKETLNVTADNQVLTFGDSVPSYTFTYGTFKAGDDEASITTAPTCTSAYTNTTSVGSSTLPITCSGGLATNYTFNFIDGTLTINKANQTISFTQPNAMTVGVPNQDLTYSTSSALPVTVTPTNSSICAISGTAVVAVAAGDCELNASQAGNVDYNPATQVSVTFTISAGSTGGSGGGGGQSTTVTPGPKINSISKTQLCATGNEILIVGTYFDGGVVTLDGVPTTIRSITSTNITVLLPQAVAGIRTIRVATPFGADVAIIEYVSVPKPRFETIRIPYLAQNSPVDLLISASNTSSYRIDGQLPSGLSFNSVSGRVSGLPTENGIFVFTIVASGICGDTSQVIELDLDAPTPNAISHRINFLPGSCDIPDSAEASLQRFLEEAKGISPRNIIPEIYVSGGFKSGDPDSELAKCRQNAICDFLLLEELLGQILTDVFNGSENRIEIIVYWPRPNDDR